MDLFLKLLKLVMLGTFIISNILIITKCKVTYKLKTIIYNLCCIVVHLLGLSMYSILNFIKINGYMPFDDQLLKVITHIVMILVMVFSYYYLFTDAIETKDIIFSFGILLFDTVRTVLAIIIIISGSIYIYNDIRFVHFSNIERRLEYNEKKNKVISERVDVYSVTLISNVNGYYNKQEFTDRLEGSVSENEYYLVNTIDDNKIDLQKVDVSITVIYLDIEENVPPYMETFIKGSGTNSEHIEKIELHIPKEGNKKFKISLN